MGFLLGSRAELQRSLADRGWSQQLKRCWFKIEHGVDISPTAGERPRCAGFLWRNPPSGQDCRVGLRGPGESQEPG